VLIRFHGRAFLIALVVFGMELLIATVFASSPFIRGSVSDFLVVILIFCAILAFIRVPHLPLAGAVLLLAWAVEVAQWFGLADALGFARGSLPSILIGTTFSWEDLLMYTLGCMAALLIGHLLIRES
jgi:hypothetical protein